MTSPFAHLVKDDYTYSCKKNSNIEMCILSYFLISDVACSSVNSYLELLYDPEFRGGCGNATCIEKEGGYISICLEVDVREEEDQAKAVWFKIAIPQFITLL